MTTHKREHFTFSCSPTIFDKLYKLEHTDNACSKSCYSNEWPSERHRLQIIDHHYLFLPPLTQNCLAFTLDEERWTTHTHTQKTISRERYMNFEVQITTKSIFRYRTHIRFNWTEKGMWINCLAPLSLYNFNF